MDANGTRFHLLLGQSDWSRCRTVRGEPAFSTGSDVHWNAPRNEVTLWPDTFRFGTTRGARPLTGSERRGAARDRFDNWYWISADERSIQVLSSGTGNVTPFWPAPSEAAVPARGGFRPARPITQPPALLRALTVTEDHYLVCGTVDEDSGRGALVVFDLYSGGPEATRRWPVPFAPFAMSPRAGGGVWVLDASTRRVWELDRRYEIVTDAAVASPPIVGGFSGATPLRGESVVPRATVRPDQGWLVPGTNAVVDIAALPHDGVLVLESDDGTGFARVHWLAGGVPRGAPASTRTMAEHIEVEEGDDPFTLRAHAFTLGERDADDPPEWVGRLYIVGADGNQAFAFGVSTATGALELVALAEYFPMRLFSGRALVTAGGSPWYDFGDAFTPLVAQHRPRYVESGELWTPVFDGAEPDCVWHRLMLDACIPAGAAVDVYTRAADDWRELTLAEWMGAADRRALAGPDALPDDVAMHESDLAAWQPEPAPYLRGDGPELPWLPRETGAGRGTWELLFQRARGRYLQVKLVLRGDGRSTPRIRALRAWFPRFSYLEHYLPGVYRQDADSASFLERFLANMEGTLTATEDRIAAAQLLFDVSSAPGDTLEWLGRWFGVALDPSWSDDRRRLFLRHAMDFFAARGTMRGLEMALRLALDECVDDRLFDAPRSQRASPVRIIERFRSRRTPPSLLGDVQTTVGAPRRADPAEKWRPSSGGADLSRRYREALTLPGSALFPVVPPDPGNRWREFAQQTLGFVPRVGGEEQAAWRRWLLLRYHGSATELRAEQGSGASFDTMRVPLDEPSGAAGAAWTAYLAAAPSVDRARWGDFLARRYRSVAALNERWRTHWTAFARVPVPDQLPPDGAALADWFEFEGTVIAMHRTAHRFSVMLPVPTYMRTDSPAQQRRIALATAVLELEKPAHTVFDVRFYWAMFRLGEARLGDDTVIDLGSRAPELMRPMVLGQGYLAQAFLAARPGADAPSRLQVGRDRVGRSARLGGP